MKRGVVRTAIMMSPTYGGSELGRMPLGRSSLARYTDPVLAHQYHVTTPSHRTEYLLRVAIRREERCGKGVQLGWIYSQKHHQRLDVVA
jgi:hypothetical protein